MSKLYKDLLNIINFVPDKEEEKATEKYFRRLQDIFNFQNSVPIFILLFVLFLYCFGGYMGCILFVALVVVFFLIYKWHQKRFRDRMDSSVKNCIFSKALTQFMVMSRYTRRGKEAQVVLPAIGNTLFNLGRFEEAKNVTQLMKKYCDTPIGNMHRISLCAAIARYEMDKAGVEQYTKELQMLIPQMNTPYINKLYDAILKYPLYMEVEENCDYARALELLKEEPNDPLLKKVSRSHRLCKIAISAGLDDEAAKHRAFVLENGGDTFYRRELEKKNQEIYL